MPKDYKRFNGPEDSVSYKRFTKGYLKTYDELIKELLNDQDVRQDGRALSQSRNTVGTTQVISQAKGSAYVEQGKTKVVCSVFDPREIPRQSEFSQLGELHCEVKFAPFSCPRRRRPHLPDAEEKALSVDLKRALEPAVCRNSFPNYQVDIYVYILEHNGSCLATAINAAGLALADAAVPMYDVITASSVAIVGDKIIIDPTEPEEHLALMNPEKEMNHGLITLSALPELKQISHFTQIGCMDAQCIVTMMDTLEQECLKIVPHVQKVLVGNLAKGFEQKQELELAAKDREEQLNAKIEEWKKIIKWRINYLWFY